MRGVGLNGPVRGARRWNRGAILDPYPWNVASTPVRPTERQVQPRVYETVRVTEVHEQPLQSSRVITQISGGTRINVVRSDGDWLEIISKRGNPPGFILREHARLAGTAN